MYDISYNFRSTLTAVALSACLASGCSKEEANKKADATQAEQAPQSKPALATVDLSTPKAAAIAYVQALADNNMAAVRAASFGGESAYKAEESQGAQFAAQKEFDNVMVAKFGDAGKPKNVEPTPANMLEQFDIKVEGDTATLLQKGRPFGKSPLKLVKKGGQWKVDLASRETGSDANVKMALSVRKAVDDTTAELKAGKYATAEEARKTFEAKTWTARGLPPLPAMPPDPTPGEVSLPRPGPAAAVFFDSIEDKDISTAKAASVGNDEAYKAVAELMSALSTGNTNFDDAIRAKFGNPGDASRPVSISAIFYTDTKVTIQIDGESATLIDSASRKVWLKMKKFGPNWKVDLLSMGDAVKEMSTTAAGLKKALDDTAAEVAAGKYKTAADARHALSAKVEVALGTGTLLRPLMQPIP